VVASYQSAERLIPFIFLMVSLVVMTFYGSVSEVVTLGAVRAATFWVVETAMVILALLWIFPRFKWPADSWKAFALKILGAALFCSITFAGPSFVLDIVFGLADINELMRASLSGLAVTLAYEIVMEALVLLAPCLLILTALTWLTRAGPFGDMRDRAEESSLSAIASANDDSRSPPFWNKLQRKRHGRLLALEAQQHYVVVHTTVGSELIHYGFGDAVKELKDWEGAQVHRSFWIARSAITDIMVDGRNSVAVLSTGFEVPISRGRRQQALARFAP
jgi:hypothetical protein